ncbi:MAG: hypothetical protein JXR71_02460 [Bacteroidales bacterium]|nr:hypothetical protein [Bacteroidales bacterium]
MNITTENYGLYVIDYFDGNLSEKEQALLLHFLEEHPELKEKVDQLTQAHLQAPAISYPDKEKLKKPEISSIAGINEDNYEEFLLLSLDCELSAEEENSLKLFLERNPQLKTEREAFSKTKLIPDTSIAFTSKAQLKKRVTLTPTLWISSIAAAFILLLGWSLFFKKGNPIKYKRPNVVAFVLQPQSMMWQNKIPEPSLLPAPRVKKYRSLHQTPAYVRNPVLIAQLPQRSVQKQLISQASPNIIPVNVLSPPIDRGIMASRKPEKKKGHFLLALLEGGVKAVNLVTNKEVLLVKTYNQQGQLVHYQILSDNFNFDRQFKNKK